MSSLTSHLLSLEPPLLEKATTHPFLTLAAKSQLPHSTLKDWLAQDRLYALSYPTFIGSILSHLTIPCGPDRESTLEWRVTDALIDALDNIRRELKLFEDTAEQEGWTEKICSPDVEVARATRCYQDLFAGACAQGKGLLGGMVVLWGTEECYLRAWRFAKEQIDGEEGDVMKKTFIPNWSSVEFEAFVRRLGGLVDEIATKQGIEPGSQAWKEAENAFRQVMWVESEFWPTVPLQSIDSVTANE